MSRYEPFLISDLKTGKSIGREPWLSPTDAFPTLINMQVNKGVLEKRLGYAPFATMKHGAVEQSNTAITGIKTYLNKGMPTLLIMDTKRANRYNAVKDTMIDVSNDVSSPIDIFSGAANDHFSFVNWLETGYMVNNVDQIHRYSGDAVTPFDIPVDSGATENQVSTARFVFVKDDRLLLLAPTVKGSYIPNQLNFSEVLRPIFNSAGAGSVQAETQETISAAGFVGKDIAVFFRGPKGGSLWRIRTTGDSTIPFKWERVSRTEGCRAPYSGVEFEDGLAAVGLNNILFYDGFRKILNLEQPNLRDILSEFDDAVIQSVTGYNQNEEEHLLFNFAATGSSVTDRILDYNVVDNNWTIHKSAQSFFLNSFGGFNGQKVPTFVELDDVITFDGDVVSNMTVDSRAILGTPSLFTLIGGRNSQVYKWNSGAFDGTNNDSGKIEIDARSSRWNPFTKEGRRVKFGRIKLLLDNDATASFTISFFKNTSSTAYKTQVVSCDGSNDKFWETISVDGEVGDFHRIKISHTEKGNRPRIHAFLLFMKAAGHLDL